MILVSPFLAIEDPNCSNVQKAVAGCAIGSGIVSATAGVFALLLAMEAGCKMLGGKIVYLLTKGSYTTWGAGVEAPVFLLMASTLFRIALVFAGIYGGLVVLQKTVDLTIG